MYEAANSTDRLTAARQAAFLRMEKMMPDNILNVGEAAKMLGVDRTTLWRMHAKYKMIAPPARFSIGRTGYLRSYLENWMQEQMNQSIQSLG